MAVSDFLFQNQAPAAFTNSVTERADMPLWYQSARQQAISRASSIAGAPYTAYQGPRVAGFTDHQNQGFGMASNAAQQGNPFQNTASNLFQQSAQPFDQGTFDQFMNPYSEGLNDKIAQLGMRNFNENLAPALQDSFVGNGMFGSSRHADLLTRAARDTQDSILNQQSQNLFNSYNSAMGNYQTAMNRVGQAGEQLGNLGQQSFQNQLTGAAALEGIGGEQQNLNQQNLDTAYSDFQNQLNYPKTQLDWLNSVISGYAPPQNTTQTSTGVPAGAQNSPGALSQVLSNLVGYSGTRGAL